MKTMYIIIGLGLMFALLSSITYASNIITQIEITDSWETTTLQTDDYIFINLTQTENNTFLATIYANETIPNGYKWGISVCINSSVKFDGAIYNPQNVQTGWCQETEGWGYDITKNGLNKNKLPITVQVEVLDNATEFYIYAGNGTTVMIVTSTDEGTSAHVAHMQRVFWDPLNKRWHVSYIDASNDVHSQSSLDGITWVDGIDWTSTNADYEDLESVMWIKDGISPWVYTVKAGATSDNLLYVITNFTDTSPFVEVVAGALTIMDNSNYGIAPFDDSLDDYTGAGIIVDDNGCVVISTLMEDDSQPSARQTNVVLFRENGTGGNICGDGTLAYNTASTLGEKIHSVQDYPGGNQDGDVGMYHYPNSNDVRLVYLNTTTTSAVSMMTRVYWGDNESFTPEINLNNDIEYSSQSETWGIVGFDNTTLMFAVDDSTTDLDAHILTSKTDTIPTKVDTGLNVAASHGTSEAALMAVGIDTRAPSGNDIYVFALNTTMVDISIAKSTDNGSSWETINFLESIGGVENKYFSVAFNNDSCKFLLTWVNGTTSPFGIVTAMYTTDSCDTTPPIWTPNSNQTNSTLNNTNIIHSKEWNDSTKLDSALDTYRFLLCNGTYSGGSCGSTLTYQETADETTCADSLCDGDRTTSGVNSFMNYTKPATAINTSTWLIADTAAIVNVSIPGACWDYLEDKLVFQLTGGGPAVWQCYDGSAWQNVVIGTRPAFEEAMWWVTKGFNWTITPWTSFPNGGQLDWSNETAFVSGDVAAYCYYAKDIAGNINKTDCDNPATYQLTTPPVLTYVPPTPDNDAIISSGLKNITINITITESDLNKLIYDWNGTNFSFYDDSLIVMLNFDNISALSEDNLNVTDASKYGNDGLSVNGASPNTTGKYGGSWDFAGDGDYVDLGSDSSLTNLGGGNSTMMIWVNSREAGANDDDLVSNGAGSAGQYLFQYDGSGFAKGHIWTTGGSGIATGSVVVRDGTWHHVVQRINATHIAVFVDGVFDASATISGTKTTSGNSVYIGDRVSGGSSVYDGLLDELRIWNRSLSEAEILQMYMSNLRKYDTNKWNLYVNQTLNSTDALVDGVYTYQAHAKDIDNKWGNSKIRNLTVGAAAADTSPPTYTNFQDNSTGLTPTNSSDVQLNVTISDATGIDYYRIATNNTNGNAMTNQTLIKGSGTSLTAIFNESLAWFPSTGGIFGWQIWANDTLTGAESVSTIQTLTVQTVGGTDSCTYTSGDWDIDCTDNCVISSPVDLGGNDVTLDGNGIVTATADITNVNNFTIINSCTVNCIGNICFD